MQFSRDYEFRAVTKEERSNFDNLVKYVFANTSKEPVEDDELRNEWTTAAFHKGRLVAASGGYPFTMRFNGLDTYADGLTAVGTEPGYRRRGLVRELVTKRLHDVHEDEDQSASILWASMGAIYQRFGYGLGSTHTSVKFEPRNAMFEFEYDTKGYVTLLDENEGLPIAKRLYGSFIQDRTLDLYRDDDMWKGYFGQKKKRNFVAFYFNERDKPEGYIAYGLGGFKRRDDDIGPDQTLSVREFVYKNIGAYRALWEYVRAHDLVGKVNMDLPMDDPAFHMLLEPRILHMSVWDGIWLRLVDVDKILTQRKYPMAGSVVFEIKEDPECPWNVRKYLLETDGDTTEVKRTRKSAQFQITPHGLAGVLSGNATLTQMDRAGRASVRKRDQLVNLDTMFATQYHPFCRNGF